MAITRRRALQAGAVLAAVTVLPLDVLRDAGAAPPMRGEIDRAGYEHTRGQGFVVAGGGYRVTATLTAVRGYPVDQPTPGAGEIFTLHFRPAAGRRLPQGLYTVSHRALGTTQLLLVPDPDTPGLVATINRWLPTSSTRHGRTP